MRNICVRERYTASTPHTKSVGGEPRWLSVNNLKNCTTMAKKNFYTEENYKDYNLSENWDGKGITVENIALHLFPKTDKNPQDLIGISVEGVAHRDIGGGIDVETGELIKPIVEKGEIIRCTMFPRNLPGNISDYGTVAEKDGKKVFTPKVKIVDARYRIGALVDDEGNYKLDPNGNLQWGAPKVRFVKTADGKTINIGSNDEPVPFNG